MQDSTIPSLENPFAGDGRQDDADPGERPIADDNPGGPYGRTLTEAAEIMERPYTSAGLRNIQRQHMKNRMTIWERIRVLTDQPPKILFQNWGPNLDGASLVTAIINVEGRDVALYGHDFTIRAGSMDATNGKKLARLFELAGKRRIPLIGLNDSSGAFQAHGARPLFP